MDDEVPIFVASRWPSVLPINDSEVRVHTTDTMLPGWRFPPSISHQLIRENDNKIRTPVFVQILPRSIHCKFS